MLFKFQCCLDNPTFARIRGKAFGGKNSVVEAVDSKLLFELSDNLFTL
jgi:hypothetical protein